jgi:hypothetical protein
VSPLKIKIPVKNLGRQCCGEGFNSGVKGLIVNLYIKFTELVSLFLTNVVSGTDPRNSKEKRL